MSSATLRVQRIMGTHPPIPTSQKYVQESLWICLVGSLARPSSFWSVMAYNQSLASWLFSLHSYHE